MNKAASDSGESCEDNKMSSSFGVLIPQRGMTGSPWVEYRTTLPGVVWEGISKGGTGPAKERHGTRMSQEKDQQVQRLGV